MQKTWLATTISLNINHGRVSAENICESVPTEQKKKYHIHALKEYLDYFYISFLKKDIVIYRAELELSEQ